MQEFLKEQPYIGSNWFEAQEYSKTMSSHSKSLYSKRDRHYLDWFVSLDFNKLHVIPERYEQRRSLFEDIWKAGQQKDIQPILKIGT